MRKPIVLALAVTTTLALAAQTAYRLVIGGQVTGQAIVVGGQTYVPLSALKAAGVGVTTSGGTITLTLPGARLPGPTPTPAPSGGANQLAALEGCVGQTLFNGVWRFKVSRVEQGDVDGQPGWLITVEMRNGTQTPQFVYSTGLSNSNDAYTLAAPDGNTGVWRTGYILNDFASRTVPQAGLFTYTFRYGPDPSATPDQLAVKPDKFIMRINTKYVNRKDVPYSAPDPSFRVNLNCTK